MPGASWNARPEDVSLAATTIQSSADAVVQLRGESLRSLPMLLQFLTDAEEVPATVMAECVARLNIGTSAGGPSLEAMARHVDKSTGGSVAMGL
ncbi:MAG TPA: hypothetical protein VN969_14260 [Streptosporangiaceae bacterium]|nr:hypothetical protein [Streptosporangiaceae bacterium]